MRLRLKAFTLAEAIMVLALTSTMLLIIQRLVSYAYPIQAKKRLEIEQVRQVSVLLDEIAQQIQLGRAAVLQGTGSLPTTPISLATDKLAIRWNQESQRIVDRYSLDNIAHIIYRERLENGYVWNLASSWVPLNGYAPPGRQVLKDAEGFEVVQKSRSSINLLEVRVKLFKRPDWITRMVALP